MTIKLLLILLSLVFVKGFSSASPPLPHKTLNIAVCEGAPFAFKQEKNGIYHGISIDVWELIARQNGFVFRYIPVTHHEGIKGISDGHYDLLLGRLPDFIPQKGIKCDFTAPIYVAGTGIAYIKESGLKVLCHYFLSWNFLLITATFISVIFLQAFVFWFVEHKKNPAYKKPFWKSLGSGVWWSMGVTSTTFPSSRGETRTLAGRIMTGLCVFFSLIIVNVFLASIVSDLMVGKLSSHIQELSDLKRLNKILSIQGTFVQEFLKSHGIRSKTVSSLDKGLEALKKGEAQALLYAEPLLKYALTENPIPDIKFMATDFAVRYYSYTVPQGSLIRPLINRSIITLLDTQEIQKIVKRYIEK